MQKFSKQVVKQLNHVMVKHLNKIFNKIWSTSKNPVHFKRGVIVKIPKKGDLSDVNNWRGITLLSVPGKVLCGIIADRLRGAIEKKLREEQAGFRPNRSCSDQIFTLRRIIEKCLQKKHELVLNFIDFEKAFDSLHRESLWEILRLYGVPKKIINILRDLYEGSEASIKVGIETTIWFKIITGVRQGCILSPLLFIFAIDWLLTKALEDEQYGIKLSRMKWLEDLDFADDIVLTTETAEMMQKKTDKIYEIGKSIGLKINEKKTNVMVINNEDTTHINVKINGNALENVSNFVYLGSKISSTGDIMVEVNNRISKAAGALKKLNSVWKNTNISMQTKMKLYRANVLSTLTYGAEPGN